MPACGTCGAERWTPPITVIVVAVPGLAKRYPLIPEFEDDYRVCRNCKAIWRSVDRAVASCRALDGKGIWTEALLVCQDQIVVVHNQASDETKPAAC